MHQRWQILPLVQLVLLIPMGNLSPVSTPPRWQIMGTISGCRHLKVNLAAKIYIYVNSTTQRCPNKIIKIFLIEDFFHLPAVLLELQIAPKFWKKFETSPNGILRGLGETDSWKSQKSKISWHCPFKYVSSLTFSRKLLNSSGYSGVTWLDGEPAPVLSPAEGEGLGEDRAHRHHLLILRLVHPSLKING